MKKFTKLTTALAVTSSLAQYANALCCCSKTYPSTGTPKPDEKMHGDETPTKPITAATETITGGELRPNSTVRAGPVRQPPQLRGGWTDWDPRVPCETKNCGECLACERRREEAKRRMAEEPAAPALGAKSDTPALEAKLPAAAEAAFDSVHPRETAFDQCGTLRECKSQRCGECHACHHSGLYWKLPESPEPAEEGGNSVDEGPAAEELEAESNTASAVPADAGEAAVGATSAGSGGEGEEGTEVGESEEEEQAEGSSSRAMSKWEEKFETVAKWYTPAVRACFSVAILYAARSMLVA